MKAEIRRRYRSIREGLGADKVSASSEAISRLLAGWEPLQKASTVLTYLAFRNELDLSALFTDLPAVRWAVPRVQGEELVLHVHDPDRLVRHRFGMLEPAPDLPILAPAVMDLILVPGVAFDPSGGRLGFGSGYYDRLLPRTAAIRVGVTYDQCLADALPVEEHDQRVHWVITPTRIIAFAPRAPLAARGSARP